jgi:hypothetical protein
VGAAREPVRGRGDSGRRVQAATDAAGGWWTGVAAALAAGGAGRQWAPRWGRQGRGSRSGVQRACVWKKAPARRGAGRGARRQSARLCRGCVRGPRRRHRGGSPRRSAAAAAGIRQRPQTQGVRLTSKRARRLGKTAAVSAAAVTGGAHFDYVGAVRDTLAGLETGACQRSSRRRKRRLDQRVSQAACAAVPRQAARRPRVVAARVFDASGANDGRRRERVTETCARTKGQQRSCHRGRAGRVIERHVLRLWRRSFHAGVCICDGDLTRQGSSRLSLLMEGKAKARARRSAQMLGTWITWVYSPLPARRQWEDIARWRLGWCEEVLWGDLGVGAQRQ